MPLSGFEPAISAGDRPQTLVLDCSSTGIGYRLHTELNRVLLEWGNPDRRRLKFGGEENAPRSVGNRTLATQPVKTTLNTQLRRVRIACTWHVFRVGSKVVCRPRWRFGLPYLSRHPTTKTSLIALWRKFAYSTAADWRFCNLYSQPPI
jgi:hypothetical protein